MDINFLGYLKNIFLTYLSDIIVVNIALVILLFFVFSVVHLLRRRKRSIDDTIPYITFLKESLDELMKEAEHLKKELGKAKLNAFGNSAAVEQSEELLSLQSKVEEKDQEITQLKGEISKYEETLATANAGEGGIQPEVEKKLKTEIVSLNESMQKLKKENELLIAKSAEKSSSSELVIDNTKVDELSRKNSELSAKIQELESQLFEYEIIEDDLANLKILKEENTKLKEQLSTAGTILPSGAGSSGSEAPVLEEITAGSSDVDDVLLTEEQKPDENIESNDILHEAEEEVKEIINEKIENDEDKQQLTEEDVPDGMDPDLLNEFGISVEDISPSGVETPDDEDVSVQQDQAADDIDPDLLKEWGLDETDVKEAASVDEFVEESKPKVDNNEVSDNGGQLAEEFEKFMSENQ